jgi:hypothetical protein
MTSCWLSKKIEEINKKLSQKDKWYVRDRLRKYAKVEEGEAEAMQEKWRKKGLSDFGRSRLEMHSKRASCCNAVREMIK